ncbi:PIR protein, putative [Plasmodium sp.]|nr:PIR protein, putative [Plasmodium sp.]
MRLHYSKILLFCLLLNIFVSSSYEHNKNKTYITPHRTTTSRVLSACEIQKSIYDDPDMKSVKENFDRQTSQRFEEYEERMIKKRKRCKEQCDQDVQQIILKDKIDKSLEEKVEKCCLKCGCGLGGVAASVGLIGGVAVSELKKAATAAAIVAAKKAGASQGAVAGTEAGIKAVMNVLGLDFGLSFESAQKMGLVLNGTNYTDVTFIYEAIYTKFEVSSCLPSVPGAVHGAGPVLVASPDQAFCNSVWKKFVYTRGGSGGVSIRDVLKKYVESIVKQAKITAGATEEMVTKDATSLAIENSTAAVDATYASCQTAVIASVVAILVIVFVMMIIYLILRYRRKKKMNKKLQYTKLLNQ